MLTSRWLMTRIRNRKRYKEEIGRYED